MPSIGRIASIGDKPGRHIGRLVSRPDNFACRRDGRYAHFRRIQEKSMIFDADASASFDARDAP